MLNNETQISNKNVTTNVSLDSEQRLDGLGVLGAVAGGGAVGIGDISEEI